MGGFLSSIMERWGKFYRRSSIQVILSLSFTAVAVAGMIFLGLTLFLRFSASSVAASMAGMIALLAEFISVFVCQTITAHKLEAQFHDMRDAMKDDD